MSLEWDRSLISHSEKYSLLQKHSEKENYRRKLEKNMGSVRETGLTKHFAECLYKSGENTPEQEQRLSIWTAIILNIKDKIKISYIDMDEIKIAGWTIIANQREADIPALAGILAG